MLKEIRVLKQVFVARLSTDCEIVKVFRLCHSNSSRTSGFVLNYQQVYVKLLPW
jgi:hypothetical protein